MLLANKVALITGSATGIGQAIAEVFAENGAALILLDRNGEANQRTAAQLRSSTKISVLDFTLDLRDRPAIDAALKSARSQLGRVDILVNNARRLPTAVFSGNDRAAVGRDAGH